MTSCEWVHDRLDDYVDGELGVDDVRELEAHLESCDACRAAHRDLQTLVEQAAALPKRREPGRDLWPGIAAQLHERRPAIIDWRRHARTAAYAAAIAAAVVVAVSLGLMRAPAPPDAPPPNPIVAVEDAVEPFQDDRSVLREAYQARAAALDPELRTVIDSNLSIIDESLDEIRHAMKLAPDNPRLRELYRTACLSEVDLLRHAIHDGREG